jgi:REP element-mobilizing transposase RayT
MWKGLTRIYRNVLLDQFVIMPNHIHGIIGIIEEGTVGNASKLNSQSLIKDRSEVNNPDLEFNAEMHSLRDDLKSKRSKMLLSSIVKEYKSEVTRRIKRIEPDILKSIWQRSFYDRIIRTEREFENIQLYIYYNPLKWELDIENKMLTTKSERDSYYCSIFQQQIMNR